MAGAALPFIRLLARAACWVFYRIDRAGQVPRDGAVLILPNHPNALLDPAIVWATAERDVRFLAKSTLFGGFWRPLLVGSGAIPVYRRIDEGVDASRNSETFSAVHEALGAGDAICIFPEGISHSQGRLVPLRTGAARMALAAERAGTPVALVPVGLNFDRKTTFRSRATIVYGPPFRAPAGSPDDPEAVRALTELMTAHMRRLLVEADPKGDAALVDRVDRFYTAARERPRTPDERVARRRAIAEGIAQLRVRDPQRYDELLLRFRQYDQRLRRFGIRDSHLDWDVSTGDAWLFALREGLLAIPLLPLCAIGMALFYVPYYLTAWVARRFTNDPEVAATAKVVGGFFIYTVWLAAIAAAMWVVRGRAAGLTAVVAIPVLAVASLFAIERESAVRDAVKAWWQLRRAHSSTRARLKRKRSELADVLDEVYEWIKKI